MNLEQTSSGFEFGGFCLAGYLRVGGFEYTLGTGVEGRAPFHVARLMRRPGGWSSGEFDYPDFVLVIKAPLPFTLV